MKAPPMQKMVLLSSSFLAFCLHTSSTDLSFLHCFFFHATAAVIHCLYQSYFLKKILSAKVTRRNTGLGFTVGLGKLEYIPSGEGYVRLGLTGSHSSCHTVQALAHIAFHLTQPYFMLDSAKRKVTSAVAHLCLILSA